MSKPKEPRSVKTRPVDPDSLLAAIIERHRHLYTDITMCLGVLLVVVCMVVGAHVLADWLNLSI
jgi:hypothetical protein